MTEDAACDGLGFDNVPEIYDRSRPTYPEALFDAVAAYLQRDSQIRAVEIGSGTGQATRPLLERGIAVTAVDPGARLAAFLSKKLGGEFPALDVVNLRFEEADLEPGAYDLVLAATSFHWLEPSSRLQRCHDLLRPGGTLAIVSTNQIESTADGGFFERVQPVYMRHQQGNEGLNLPGEDVTPPEYVELEGSDLFNEPALHRYRWDQRYTAEEYGDLMRSYSGTQSMKPAAQEAMIGDVCALIDAEFGGSITRPLVITLTLARRPA